MASKFLLLIFSLIVVGISCDNIPPPPQTQMKLFTIDNDTRLECIGTSNDIPANSHIEYKWQHPIGSFLSYGSTLTLKDSQLFDTNGFMCEATIYDVGHNIDSDIIGNVPEPEIVISNINNLEFVETQYLFVTCTVKNWDKNQYRVQWVRKSSGDVVSANSILYVKSLVKNLHEGRYRCEIQNKQHRSILYTKNIDIQIKVPKISIELLSSENLQINGQIHRRCVPFQLTANSVLDTFSFRWIDSKGKIVSEDSFLTIPLNSQRAKEVYECQYTANTSKKTFKASSIVDKISVKIIDQSNYDIIIGTRPSRFEINRRFLMECMVNLPLKNIQFEWYKDNVLYSSSRDLIFAKFQRLDTGVYKCKAKGTTVDGLFVELEIESHQQLSFLSDHEFELTVRPGPYIKIISGHKKELHCEIDTIRGIIGKNVLWYFNGKEIKDEHLLQYNLSRYNRHSVSILTILDSQYENEGRYECEFGLAKKEAYIVIDNGNNLLSVLPRRIEVFEGDFVEFHCELSSRDHSDNTGVTWTLFTKDNSRSIDDIDKKWRKDTPNKVELSSFISLQSAEIGDSGFLVCAAPGGLSGRGQLIVKPKQKQVNVIISPRQLKAEPNKTLQFDCSGRDKDGLSFGQPSVTFFNGTSIVGDARFIIDNIDMSTIRVTISSGVISADELRMVCVVDGYAAIVGITVMEPCKRNYRRCTNDQCVRKDKFCDGIKDCNDGTDEDQTVCLTGAHVNQEICDPENLICQPSRDNPPIRKVVNKAWVCDGEDDCGNNFDESNCTNDSDLGCHGLLFTCGNNATIPRGFVCDGSPDCPSMEDEHHCTNANIVTISSTRVNAKMGQQVIIECEATGYPLPVIVWRFNKGCVPDPKRMKVSVDHGNCLRVKSILTIDDVMSGDDGVYNCEAMNSRSRAMSSDIIVAII